MTFKLLMMLVLMHVVRVENGSTSYRMNVELRRNVSSSLTQTIRGNLARSPEKNIDNWGNKDTSDGDAKQRKQTETINSNGVEQIRKRSIYNATTLNATDASTSLDPMDLDVDNSTANCTNDYCASDEEYIDMIEAYMFPSSYEWFLIGLHSMVFLIGLVGNALVCVAVYRNHTMRTVTNYFIVNLAVADFMVILFCLPPTVLWDVTETWFMGEAMCKIVLYLQTVSVTVSVLTLTFISVDRWYAICFPLKFKSTTGRAKTAIVIIWLLALSFDIPELIVLTTTRRLTKIETDYFTQCEASWSQDSDTTWSVVKMVLLYAFPLAFMSVAYFQIVKVLWQSDNIPGQLETTGGIGMNGARRNNTFTMNANSSTQAQLRSRRKAAKMLVAVVVMFAVCYFPVHLFSVMRLTMSLVQNDTNTALALLSHWMCYANSAVNPVIYNFMSGKFRKEFRTTFGCSCSARSSRRRHTHVTRSSTYVYRYTTGGSINARTEILPLSQLHTSPSQCSNHLTHGHRCSLNNSM